MDSPWASGENNVSRISISAPLLRTSETFSLSSAQVQIASLEVGFTHEACNLRTLTGMVVGSLAFKASRLALTESFSALGWMGNSITATSLRGLAWTSATAIEVSAFRGTGQLLSDSPSTESIFNPQSFMSSYIDFITLKTGALFHTQSLGLRRFIQDSAVVAGHQIGHAFGYTTQPSGSLSEQFLHAEAMNTSLGIGTGLAGALTGHRIHRFERNLEARLERSTLSNSRQELRTAFNPEMNSQRERLPITRSPFLPSDARSLVEFLRVDKDVAGLQTVTNRPSSRSHLENSRRNILEAAALVPRAGQEPTVEGERLVAVVLGAGNCSEIPVVELVRQHKFRVTLVDISEGGLKTSLEALPDDVKPFVRGVVTDLTDGLLFEIARKVQRVTSLRNRSLVERVPLLVEIMKDLETLKDRDIQHRWLELVGEEKTDLVVGSMVVNQAFAPMSNRISEAIEHMVYDFANTVLRGTRPDPALSHELSTNAQFGRQLMGMKSQMVAFHDFSSLNAIRFFVSEMRHFLNAGSVVYCSIDLSQQTINHETSGVQSIARLPNGRGNYHRRLREIFPSGMRIVDEKEWQWDVDRTDERAESARIYGPAPRLVVWRSIGALTLMPETFRQNVPTITSAPEGVAPTSEPGSVDALQQSIQADLRSDEHNRRGGDALKAGLESPDADVALNHVEIFRRLSLTVPDRLPRDCLIAAVTLLQRHPRAEVVTALKAAQTPIATHLGASQKVIVAAHLTLAKQSLTDAAVQKNLNSLLGALKVDTKRVQEAMRSIQAAKLSGMSGAGRMELITEMATGMGMGLLTFVGVSTYDRLHHVQTHPAITIGLSFLSAAIAMFGVHQWIKINDAPRLRPVPPTADPAPSPVMTERAPEAVVARVFTPRQESAFIDWISLPAPESLAGEIRERIQAAPEANRPEPEYVQRVLTQMQAQVSWRYGTLPWPAEFQGDGKRDGLRLPYEPYTRLAMVNAFASQMRTLHLNDLSLMLRVFADTTDHFETGDVREGTMMLREGVRGFPEFIQPALYSLRALFALRLLREYQNNPQVMNDEIYRDLVFWLVKARCDNESIADNKVPSHELQELAIYALQRIAKDPTEDSPLNEFTLLREFREYRRRTAGQS